MNPDAPISAYRDLLTELAATAQLVEVATPAADAAPPAPPDEGAPPFYASVDEWVEHHFTVLYARDLRQRLHWCEQWWEHPEAVIRFEALWRTWEVSRLDPVAGMATWLRMELDHHLPILLGDEGPFSQCAPESHGRPKLDPLPVGQRSNRQLTAVGQ